MRTTTRIGLVEQTIALGGRELLVLRPRDPEDLLDDDAFEHEEFLPYWGELWPSGLALARAVGARRLAGARVLELGCGLALPSLAAAGAGARVTASDWSPEAVALAALNAARNALPLETLTCAWDEPERLLAHGPWDLVLAADVLYERRNVEPLLDALSRLVESPGEAVLADPGRPPAAAFLELAAGSWEIDDARDPLAPHVTLYTLRRRA